MLLLSACASTTSGTSRDAFVPSRIAVAEALYQVDIMAPGADDALIAAWEHRGALVDDAVLRRLIRAIEPAPDGLEAAKELEAIAMLGASPEASAQAQARLRAITDLGDDLTRWTAARRHLLEASLQPPAAEQQALQALRRARSLAPTLGTA